MDWKGARFWSLCLLVLCPVVLGKANPAKTIQDDADEPSALQSESKVTFVAKEASQIPELRDDSTNVSGQSSSNGRSLPVFQIETPIVIKKIKRGSKIIRKDGKSLKSFNKQNQTSDELNKQQSKPSTVSVPVTRDPSVPEESQRIENVRRNHDILRIPDQKKQNNERNFAPAHFIPSENFPRNTQSQSHQASKSSGSIPVGNGEIKYVLSIQPGSSEENSRSEVSAEQFDSKRRRDPSSNFNGHQYSTDLPNNQFQGTSNHQNNAFAPPEAQRVTIVKEKSVHSTSREEAQERVNIEKNPLHKESTNEVFLEQHPRTFQSPQNTGAHGLNSQEEKVLLIEGTHIPGRNYGPEDDTFGFYTDSYKEEKPSSEHPNRQKIKVVKVVKTRGEERVLNDIPLNNHGNGQSRQYFLSEQQNLRNNKVVNQQPSGKHFSGQGDRVHLVQVPQIQQNEENHFIPVQINENAKQTAHSSVPQNLNFDNIVPKNTLQSNSGSVNKFTPQRANTQHVILNINPDPNQLYIDENTGQFIKFVVNEDSTQNPHSNVVGRNFNNKKSSEGLFPQRHEEPQRNVAGHLQQKGFNQLQNHNAASVLGGHNSNAYSSASGLNDHHNLQEGVKYIQISDGDAVHIINNDAVSNNEKQVYYIPQEQISGNQYLRSQGNGHSNSNDDSEEYVILCDQEGEDYSGEYQSGDLGSVNHNIGSNNYQQSNVHSQNQMQSSGYALNAGLNHNKGHPSLNNQGKNSGYDTSSENHNFLKQNFGTRLPSQEHNQQKSTGNSQGSIYVINQQEDFKGTNFENSDNKGGRNYATSQVNGGAQGHYKGSAFSDGGVTNFATPATNIGAQDQYKSSEFSNNEGDLHFGTPQITIITQGHSKGSEFPQKGLDISTLQIDGGGQGNYKGNQLSNNKGNVDFGSHQINSGIQTHGSGFSNNKGAANFPTQENNAGVQGHYKGSEFPNNNGAIHFVTLQVNSGAQGHYKGSEFSSNKGGSNFATPQINSGAQGHYKGSEFSNNKGGSSYATPQINSGAQGHYKGSEFSNNKGGSNYDTPQINSGAQGHYKGSEFSNNKGGSNYATPQINSGAQGHYKGSEFSNNKGGSNYATPQINSGAQGHYKGSEFSNNKGGSNYATPQINSGAQGHYKGSEFSNNKGGSNYVTPQINSGAQGHYKGSEFSNNKGGSNYVTPHINSGAQGHYKGSEFPNNKGASNFASAQVNSGVQGHYKGSEFPNNKGASNFETHQIDIEPQGHYKGTQFSNNKQNSKVPVYREVVTPAYPVDNFASLKGNNKGTNFQLHQNQGNFNPGVKGISSGNHNTGSIQSNQKGYANNNNVFSNAKGNSGYSKGSELHNQNQYIDNSAFSNNQNYGGDANIFSGAIDDSRVLGIQSGKGYNSGTDALTGIILSPGLNKGSEFPAQKGYNSDNSNNKGYDISQEDFSSIKGNNKGSFVSNQKGYNAAQGNNKGSELPPAKGYEGGNEFHANQDYSLEDPLKGPVYAIEKGASKFPGVVSDNENRGISFANQKGVADNIGYSQGKISNSEENNYDQALFLNQHGITLGINNQKGYSRGNDKPHLSDQNGYMSPKDIFSSNSGYIPEGPFIDSLSLKGDQGDLALLIQKGYNAGNELFLSNKGNPFSGDMPSKGFNEGPQFPIKKDFNSGSNHGQSGNKGYNTGARVELFSDVISSKGLNKGSGFSNNKGFKPGNNGYQTSVSESYPGSFPPQSSNKGLNRGVQKGYDSGSNTFSGNKGYNDQSNSFSSNKGYEKGSNAFIQSNRNNFKGTPIKPPQNNDYGRHINSVPAVDNNYKGSNFAKNAGNSRYGNQQIVGYSDESLKGSLQGQQHNTGNDQYGVSYSSSEEITHQPIDQQYSGKQEPVQYILVEEDIPGAKNGNEEAVYYLQHEGGRDQEKTYLIVDDPSLQQHPNLRVMVDGGKDRTFPIRQLATVGLHMARSVIPQIRNNKAKSIKGKISFGVEIKKGAGQSDGSQHYLESRIDNANKKSPQGGLKQTNKK